MFITVLACGLPGDVQPLLALAGGLRDIGHTVRVATHQSWHKPVSEAGLEFSELPGDIRKVVTDRAFLTVMESGRRPDRMAIALWSAATDLAGRLPPTRPGLIRPLSQLGRTFDEALLAGVWSAARGSDALVFGSPLAFHGYYAARAHGIPSAAALTQPLDYAAATRQSVGRQAVWQMFRGSITNWQRRLGVPVAPLFGPFRHWRDIGFPVVYGLSSAVLRRPEHWTAHQHLTGYWFLDSTHGTALSPEVERFLAAGPPPVYVTFGSMPARDPKRLTDLVTAAAARTGDRVILDAGWGGLQAAAGDKTALCVEQLPLDLVLPRVRAVVHHGGVMVTAEGLRAGLPTVVVPSVLDQFDWGKRVAAAGAGPQAVPRRRLTAANLAAALAATRDERMVRTAAALGSRIRGERGIARAAAVLDDVFGG
ncbi:glycosyltransferase [Kibdelosporangium aridum]|uniref:Glycosyltransferase n=1 Tax=Kibdelosporangium aridum TaxID=2030 RepID=A0A428Z516_KIBAR|nr:glycosyltransferase [Kibdelosporangium aridum]RSM81926.1 glycosyltransferase [Kibdelosporangium aridum]